MILLLKACEYSGQELRDVLRTLLDDLYAGQDRFLPDVCAVVGNALQYFVVELPRQLSRTNLTDNAKHQAYDAVVGASQVHSEPVGSHHQELGFLVE